MLPLSIVIVCKNEARHIGEVLQPLEGITDDVLIYDNGSTDDTLAIVRAFPFTRIHQGPWLGYGKTKFESVLLAKYDWILALDADEIAAPGLKNELSSLSFDNITIIHSIKRNNFFKNKHLRFGEWGNDWQRRLFNRKHTNWETAEVHEGVAVPLGSILEKLHTPFQHQTVYDIETFRKKQDHYARLSADKYFRQGKRSSFIKRELSPVFNFCKYYLIRLGFLDGYYGYICARMSARYTRLKYRYLQHLEQKTSTS